MCPTKPAKNLGILVSSSEGFPFEVDKRISASVRDICWIDMSENDMIQVQVMLMQDAVDLIIISWIPKVFDLLAMVTLAQQLQIKPANIFCFVGELPDTPEKC